MAPPVQTLSASLDAVEAEFALDKADLDRILARFLDRMDHGLANDGQDMAMIPSFGAFWTYSPVATGQKLSVAVAASCCLQGLRGGTQRFPCPYNHYLANSRTPSTYQ